jgi:hypothetical protein
MVPEHVSAVHFVDGYAMCETPFVIHVACTSGKNRYIHIQTKDLITMQTCAYLLRYTLLLIGFTVTPPLAALVWGVRVVRWGGAA